MGRTWISIALFGCIAVSAACSRKATTQGIEPPSIPVRNEMQIKQELLQEYSLPEAVDLELAHQIKGLDASRLQYPVSIALSDDGDIYISDNNGDAIYHTSPGLKALNKLPAEDGHLQDPNTIQVGQNEILIADNDGIKIFGRNGSFQKLLRIYYAVFNFAVDSAGNIFANPIFVTPKESDSLVVSLNKEGTRVGSFGQRLNRKEHDGLEDRTYLCMVDEKVIVAFKHRPSFQIYNSKTGELLREINVTHPVFPDLAKLEQDKKFVNPKQGVVRLPVYISGADVNANKIYLLLALPRPEIVEFDIQGEEIARYRAKSSVSAFSYFGFRVRSVGGAHQFTLGMFNQYRDPVLMAFSSGAKTNERKEDAK